MSVFWEFTLYKQLVLIFYFIGIDRLMEISKKRTVGESDVKEETVQIGVVIFKV